MSGSQGSLSEKGKTCLLTCKDFLREMSEYLDDSVDTKLRAELELHVSQCPNCFVVVDTTKRTLQVYKGMEAQDVPAGVKGRLMAAIEKKIAARRARGCAPAAAQNPSTGQAPR